MWLHDAQIRERVAFHDRLWVQRCTVAQIVASWNTYTHAHNCDPISRRTAYRDRRGLRWV